MSLERYKDRRLNVWQKKDPPPKKKPRPLSDKNRKQKTDRSSDKIKNYKSD